MQTLEILLEQQHKSNKNIKVWFIMSTLKLLQKILKFAECNFKINLIIFFTFKLF